MLRRQRCTDNEMSSRSGGQWTVMFSSRLRTWHSCFWRSRKSLYQKRSYGQDEAQKKNIRSTVYYLSSLGVLTVGLSYAAVPLYKMFCQVSSLRFRSKSYHFTLLYSLCWSPSAVRRSVTAERSVTTWRIPKWKWWSP